jgi:hypothetical protein
MYKNYLNRYFAVLLVGAICGSSSFPAAGVLTPNPAYAVHIPAGWDTIPSDTISSKLKQIQVDAGIYFVGQSGYFSGSYALITFVPTLHELNKVTFAQMQKEMEVLNRQSEAADDDALQVTFVNMAAEVRNGSHCIRSYFSVVKDSVAMEHCQTLYPSKFGYVSVMLYKKAAGGIPVNEAEAQLADMIRIQPEYQYREPEKGGISFMHVAISLAVGLLVYGLIALLTQKRKRK